MQSRFTVVYLLISFLEWRIYFDETTTWVRLWLQILFSSTGNVCFYVFFCLNRPNTFWSGMVTIRRITHGNRWKIWIVRIWLKPLKKSAPHKPIVKKKKLTRVSLLWILYFVYFVGFDAYFISLCTRASNNNLALSHY